MRKEIIKMQYADRQNPPKVNVNFAGTGFVSVIDEDGVPIQKTAAVPNMITKEILWQLNHGKIGNDSDRWNMWEIQQMFTHCALGDGNWDGSLVANDQIDTYVPQEGVDLARPTTLGMFHLDNIQTKFQDSYFTSTGFSGSDDMWDAVNRIYTFKFRRSYRFNMFTGVSPFICREVGLFAKNGNNSIAGALPSVPTWITANQANTEHEWTADPDRPSAGNPLGFPWNMCARLVLPMPLVVNLNQSIVVTYDFTMTVDCNSQNVTLTTSNSRTGEVSDPLTGKLGFAFNTAGRTAFQGYRTLPRPGDSAAPGAVWSSLNNMAKWNSNNTDSWSNVQGGNTNKGFLSPNNILGNNNGMYGQYKATSSSTQPPPAFSEDPMATTWGGTAIPAKSNEESNFHYHVKSNHARFQSIYTYEIRLPYRGSTEATIYPNDFNIGGVRLFLDPVSYGDGLMLSPIEWRPSRQFFISVSVAISFNNFDSQGNALPSDRNIATEDWGYDLADIPNHVYDSFGEWGETPNPVSNPAVGQMGYFLREWDDGDGNGTPNQKMYFPIWWKNVGGTEQWWIEDDLPVSGGVLPDGEPVPVTQAGVAYYEWDKNIAEKENVPSARKPFRRGFMIDSRDGNVYICLCAHFANSVEPKTNEYRWIMAEPFRLRQILVDNTGTPYSEPQYIGSVYDGQANFNNIFNKYGNASSDPRGRYMTKEPIDGRLYSQYEIMNSNSPVWAAAYSANNLPATISPSSGKRGIAPAGWHAPSDGEQAAFFHGMLRGSENNNGNGNVTPTGGGNDSRIMLMSPHYNANGDPFGLAAYYVGYRYSGGWNYRGNSAYWWSSSSQVYRNQFSGYAYVSRNTADSQNRYSLLCFKD